MAGTLTQTGKFPQKKLLTLFLLFRLRELALLEKKITLQLEIRNRHAVKNITTHTFRQVCYVHLQVWAQLITQVRLSSPASHYSKACKASQLLAAVMLTEQHVVLFI